MIGHRSLCRGWCGREQQGERPRRTMHLFVRADQPWCACCVSAHEDGQSLLHSTSPWVDFHVFSCSTTHLQKNERGGEGGDRDAIIAVAPLCGSSWIRRMGWSVLKSVGVAGGAPCRLLCVGASSPTVHRPHAYHRHLTASCPPVHMPMNSVEVVGSRPCCVCMVERVLPVVLAGLCVWSPLLHC